MGETWKKKSFQFLSSQIVSLFGSMLVQYAITWSILLETQSGAMVTISILCGFLPTFFIAPFAGVWADRYNRKILIIVSDAAIALSTLVLAVLFMLGYGEIWLLFAVSVVRSFGAGIQTPAVSAILPQIVPTDKLTRVNGLFGSVQSAVMLISPMAAGALLGFASIVSIFFIDVVTAAVAIFILSVLLHVPTHAKALEKRAVGYFSDLRDGIAYIAGHGYVKAFFLYCTLFFILAAPAAFLTPLQVARRFGDDVWRLSAIEMVFSIGMMAGGGVMAAWGGFRNKVRTMMFASFVFAVCTVALGLVPVFWLYLVIMGLFGVTMPVFNTPAMVLLQQKVEENYLGRVFGVMSMISSIMMPLGMLVFGPLADVIRIEWLLVGTGGVLAVVSFFFAANRTLVAAGEPPAAVAEGASGSDHDEPPAAGL